MQRFSTLVIVSLTGLAVGLLTGCPRSNAVLVTGSTGPVTPVIGASSTRGDAAPFEVVFTGVDSSSTAGSIVQWIWDFDDGSTGSGVSVSHTFTAAGRYDVTLTVTDSEGNSGTSAVAIRISGSDAVTAVIQATPNSGEPPLAVSFDGTASSAPDDIIRDYLWDFGDGSNTSIESSPIHIYAADGTYTVQLTVTTAGGVSAEADPVEIVVGGSAGGSLEFTNVDLATLPTNLSEATSAFTFEAWIRADQTGGTLARFGEFIISTNAVANTVSAGFGSPSVSASVPVLDRVWRHVAVAYEDGVGVNIYVDGALLGSGALSGSTIPEDIIIGQGFSGNVARVAFFAEFRSAGNIAIDATNSAAPSGENIVGYWPFSGGTGQRLFNAVLGNFNGLRGTSSSAESVDPRWSSDSPTF